MSAAECDFYTGISCDAVDTWDASPFLFSPFLSTAASNFSSAASRPRFYSNLLSPPLLPCPRFSRHFTLFFFTFVKSPSAMSYPR